MTCSDAHRPFGVVHGKVVCYGVRGADPVFHSCRKQAVRHERSLPADSGRDAREGVQQGRRVCRAPGARRGVPQRGQARQQDGPEQDGDDRLRHRPRKGGNPHPGPGVGIQPPDGSRPSRGRKSLSAGGSRPSADERVHARVRVQRTRQRRPYDSLQGPADPRSW